MPIFRSATSLVYYAHIPKCGGSAVETYLSDRFGRAGAFLNTRYTALPAARRWTRSSPQHVDAQALGDLFPDGFFDAIFTIVRHPVNRMVSAYHFQAEVEQRVPAGCSFGDWLDEIPDLLKEDPYAYDNHIRPMTDLVPAGADVFHLEYSLDALVPWCDRVLGRADGARRVPHTNRRNEYTRRKTARVTPSAAEIARIGQIYAADFDRFGYRPEDPMPAAPPPELPAPETPAAGSQRDGAARLRRWVAGTFGR